jgi:hypothetical protein
MKLTIMQFLQAAVTFSLLVLRILSFLLPVIPSPFSSLWMKGHFSHAFNTIVLYKDDSLLKMAVFWLLRLVVW